MSVPEPVVAEAAQRVCERIERLGQITDEPPMLSRAILSPAMKEANRQLMAWMRESELAVEEDALGNVFGCLKGEGMRRRFVIGSHLDTVRDAGRYDGPMGILLGLACIEVLRTSKQRLPFDLEIASFTDEEGLRFKTTYLGSRSVTGMLTDEDRHRRDEQGTTFGELLSELGFADSEPPPRYTSDNLLGYYEIHIEQGCVLESEELPLGLVTGIAAQERIQVEISGEANHAGTTPMDLRHDALVGAADFVATVEAQARAVEGLVATVGELKVFPGAANVIPGHVRLMLDIRHPYASTLERARETLFESLRGICKERKLSFLSERTMFKPEAALSPRLRQFLAESLEEQGHRCHRMSSGAGHDAVILSKLTEALMLFVRCRSGLSHHPDEYASPEDIEAALAVSVTFLLKLQQAYA